jgi:hypothetical protein
MDTATINVLFVVVAVLVVAGLVTWVVLVVRRASSNTRTGDARLAAELQSAVRNPPVAGPTPTVVAPDAAPVSPATGASDASPVDDIEARLARLAGLHARGVITDRELAEARAKILAE